MAIVDRINEMTVGLGGDPTGGTIEDALNNLRKVSGGAGNSNEIIVVYDSSDKSAFCNKSLRELMDMITSDDGKTIDFAKVSSIGAKVALTAYRVDPDDDQFKHKYYTLEIYPAVMKMFMCDGDVAPWILNEYNSIKDSMNIDEYLYSKETPPEGFRTIFQFSGVGIDDTYFIGYEDPDVVGPNSIVRIIRYVN